MQLFGFLAKCSSTYHLLTITFLTDSRRAFSGKNVLPNIRQPVAFDVDSNDESLRSCMDHEDIKIRVIKEKRKVCSRQ